MHGLSGVRHRGRRVHGHRAGELSLHHHARLIQVLHQQARLKGEASRAEPQSSRTGMGVRVTYLEPYLRAHSAWPLLVAIPQREIHLP